ncbi:MAG: hypothetical protein ACD_4C00015G0002 [uncultured bacterium (gcode 4)]|uniref:Uncharacterized protein n=1 Tax=uncultured bacterium (gcode 4) TaxID=1234023 RepID=K2FZ41_9BACT|nr:MAG: hypothetical protein ACD_4C00015G0002 [uncultured bacterium (gcode 4)]
MFSPDSKSFTYIKKIDGKEFIIKDWKMLWEWGLPTYIPNTNSFAYTAKKNWYYILVKDWTEIGQKYQYIDGIQFSWDGKHYAITANNGWKSKIIKDWVELWYWILFFFSPDWKNFVYIEWEDTLDYMNLNWKIIWTWNYPIFSPDSKSIIYIAKNHSGSFIIKVSDWNSKLNYFSNSQATQMKNIIKNYNQEKLNLIIKNVYYVLNYKTLTQREINLLSDALIILKEKNN